MTASPMRTNNDLGPTLRRIRHEQGMTQAALSEATGIQVPYISKVENGLEAPSFPKLSALAEALGADLESLLVTAGRCVHCGSYPARVEGADDGPVE